MNKKKFKLLRITAIACFIFAIIEFTFAGLIIFSPIADELTENSIKVLGASEEEAKDMDSEIDKAISESIEKGEITEEEAEEAKGITVKIIQIFIGVVYIIEAVFFIIEALLIYRAINKGKTTLLIIFVSIGIISQLATLITVASKSAYDWNSASDLVSLLIKTIILKQVFQIRRLNKDY